MWAPQLEAVPEGWRYIAPDLRGFGESERGDALLSMDLFADDVVALLDHLHIDQAVICGLSMGGYVALSMMDRHPQRVRALILVSTRANADSEEAINTRRELASKTRSSGSKAVVDAMLPKLFSGHTREHNPPIVDVVRDMMAATTPETAAGALVAMAHRQDYRDLLGKINVSAVVVHGDQDEIIARPDMELLARQIRGARYEVIPNVGHLPNLEAPDVFNKTLSNFLSFLPPVTLNLSLKL
jgi:pimeloyl-ACP methyl ester carboxylesterase